MSKIICDVCGTTYPETSSQCPICGCVRPGEAKAVSGDVSDDALNSSGTYTYVKGGRFSKSNVRKRIRENQPYATETNPSDLEESENDNRKMRGTIIALIAMLLVLVAIVFFVVVRFFGPDNDITKDPTDNSSSSEQQSSSVDIPCNGLTLSINPVELKQAGNAYQLDVMVSPVDTTDALSYSSADEAIATVTEDGVITAVASGETVITITCGAVQIECRVVCDFEETPSDDPSVDPSEDPSVDPSVDPSEDPSDDPVDEFKLNREDFTLFSAGETWLLYDGQVDKSLIVWTTNDPSVATINNGKVTAVGPGYTKVYAEFDGTKVSCIVRCSFKDESTGGNETPAVPSTGPYTISHEDVTIAIKESFDLQLIDANGKVVNVTWRAADSYCSVSGNKITGVSKGMTKVYTAHDGQEFSCIVRVKGS